MRLPTLRRTDRVEIADPRELSIPALRTSALRVVLLAALAATLAAIILVARSAGSGRAAVLPSGATTGCVVIDMSASIAGPSYERVATTLRGVVRANQSICLIMFSDTAYELLPPNSPPGALLSFVRFFVPVRFNRGQPIFNQSPWNRFSGGTRISSGLLLGLQVLENAHVKHGSLLLVSDLDDSVADLPRLSNVALRVHQDGIPVRIVPLFASIPNKEHFAGLFGSDAFVSPSAFRHTAKSQAQPITAGPPWALIGLGVVLVLLLAGNERWNTRLEITTA